MKVHHHCFTAFCWTPEPFAENPTSSLQRIHLVGTKLSDAGDEVDTEYMYTLCEHMHRPCMRYGVR